MRTSPSASRQFRVFVSSTFSDFALEREVLRSKVFLPMSALLVARGFVLEVIDLRWGIAAEAALGHQTLRICLEEVRLCQERSPRPNFLILAGDRYGWCPLPARFPEVDFEGLCGALAGPEQALLRAWYRRDTNAVPPVWLLVPRLGEFLADALWARAERQLASLIAQALARTSLERVPPERRGGYQTSATEQEIQRGLLDAVGAERHVFAVLRSIDDIETVMGDGRGSELARYVDWDHDHWNRAAWQRQCALRARIRARPGEAHANRAFDCSCRPEGNRISAEHLRDAALLAPEEALEAEPKTLAEAVWRGLWEVLLPEMAARETARRKQRSAPEALHDELARGQARHCAGRGPLIAALTRSLETGGRKPLILHGPSGMGKSTLLAALVEHLKQARPEWLIVTRFIGADESSADTSTLLDGLTAQILPPDYPAEPRPAGDPLSVSASVFLRALRRPRQTGLLIVLDALDQLPITELERLADWFPHHLPPQVRLLVSTTPPLLASPALRSQVSASLFPLAGLDRTDGEAMLNAMLDEDHRILEPAQRGMVLDQFEISKLPLWLDLAGRQARRWTCNTHPAPLPGDPEDLIAGWFDTVAAEHGSELVAHLLAFLAASRRGLTESALWDLCATVPMLFGELLRMMYHVPEEFQRQAPPHQATTDTREWLAWVQQDQPALTAWAERLIKAGVALPLVLWVRVREDLAIYLTERDFHGLNLVDFHHARVRQVAETRMRDPVQVHQRMANYFGRRWQQGDLLALDQIVTHLASGDLVADLVDLLADPNWQVLTLRHLGVGTLERAFALADGPPIDAATRGDLVSILDAITESAHVVTGNRAEGTVGPAAELLPAQLLGRLSGRRGPLAAQKCRSDHSNPLPALQWGF